MTTPNQILIALLEGRSTEGALADRLRLPFLVIRAMLQRHEKDGLASTTILAGCLPLWTLTEKGTETASKLQPSATPCPH